MPEAALYVPEFLTISIISSHSAAARLSNVPFSEMFVVNDLACVNDSTCCSLCASNLLELKTKV